MPELPEVETIVRDLHRYAAGSRIDEVLVGLPKIVKLPLRQFRRRVIGRRIKQVHRRAKLILIELDRGWTIVIHLKMSGQLIWRPRRGRLRVGGHPIPGGLENLPNKYSHVIFNTNHGTLFFNDQRQFGFVKIVLTEKLEPWLEEQGYGPEPLTKEFTFGLFNSILKKIRKRRIKPALMDQAVVAGVGNIYADEACFAAGIRPTRRIDSLTSTDKKKLYRGLRRVMNLAIRKRGTTADDYRTASGDRGDMQKYLKVYGRDEKKCHRCGGRITKIRLAGRGTHFCPGCQR